MIMVDFDISGLGPGSMDLDFEAPRPRIWYDFNDVADVGFADSTQFRWFQALNVGLCFVEFDAAEPRIWNDSAASYLSRTLN